MAVFHEKKAKQEQQEKPGWGKPPSNNKAQVKRVFGNVFNSALLVTRAGDVFGGDATAVQESVCR